MLKAKDQTIKLFGKTILVPEISTVADESHGAPAPSSGDLVDDSVDQSHAASANSTSRDAQEQEEINKKDKSGEKPVDEKKEDGSLTQSSEVFVNPDTASRTGEESVTPSTEKEATTLKTSEREEEHAETSDSQDKTLKKPDKILPCPRCNSMDTKFCYYNNYNVNQPRHFCKNCQRYWTAGGTMRNVPVGAGRRRNKSSGAHCRQIIVSEAALQDTQKGLINGFHHPSLKCNGTVLPFGSNTPLNESMASDLNHFDKSAHYLRNGFHKPEELKVPVPYASGEKGDDQSSKSSVSSTKSMEGSNINCSHEQTIANGQSFPPQISYFPGPPSPFQWNPAQWNSSLPSSTFCSPGISMPFFPAMAYWGCNVSGAWNMPWLAQPSSPNAASTYSNGPNSPTLGKHLREENMLKSNESDRDDRDEHSEENNNERSPWVPKTLRINDLGEAAKSPIWTTPAIKHDKDDSVLGEGLFKPFPSKYDEKNHSMQVSPVLKANPAALSRSLDFHETS